LLIEGLPRRNAPSRQGLDAAQIEHCQFKRGTIVLQRRPLLPQLGLVQSRVCPCQKIACLDVLPLFEHELDDDAVNARFDRDIIVRLDPIAER